MVLQVHVDAVRREQADDVLVALADRVVQRRPAAHLLHVHDERDDVHVRACLVQHANQLERVLLACSPREHRMNRRLAVGHIDGGIGAVLEQHLHDLEIVVVRGPNQRSRAASVRGAAHVRRPEEQLHVRVRAAFEQQADDLEAGRLVRRIDRRTPSVGSRARPHRAEQRGHTVDVPLIDVGAGFDELLRKVPVRVHDRDVQRRDAVGIRQVDVRAVREQPFHARSAVLARSVEQRREAAGVEALGPTFGLDVPLVIANGGARIDGRAMRDQKLDHLGMTACGCPHQRRLPAETLRGHRRSRRARAAASRLRHYPFARRPSAPSALRHSANRHRRRLRAAVSEFPCARFRRQGSSAWRRSRWRAPRRRLCRATGEPRRRRPRRRPTAAACCRRDFDD